MTTTRKPKGKPAVELSPDAMKEVRARMALSASINGAAVIEIFQGNVTGKDTNVQLLVDGLRDTFNEVGNNDLSGLEAMLISQATALQTIFTSLARRAHVQEYQKNLESVLGLALKAQAQSRATISALVDLKYPRQATFVKQANIANGPQQVNNGSTQPGTHSHAKEIKPLQNELLEDQRNGSTHLDTRATTTPARSHTEVETLAAVHRAAKRQG